MSEVTTQSGKYPAPDSEYLTLPTTAELLGISEYRLRIAITKGLIRSKRSSKAPQARFLFHQNWVADYLRYQESPTLGMRIKAWFRKNF